MTSYLVFTSLEAAQARSATQADALGCDASHTAYWWHCIENPTTSQGAVVIDDDGHYDAAGLTPDEIAYLWTADQIDPDWFPASPTPHSKAAR